MKKLHLWLFAGLCFATAQASAGLFSDDDARAQIQQLEVRLDQLEKANIKQEEANKQQTGSMLDLLTQIESLNQELRRLRGQNEELEHNLQDAKNRQKDFYVDLDARMRHFEAAEAAAQSASSDVAAIESSAYEVIYAYYKAANYEKVLESSRDFLKKFPDSSHTPNVHYLMGDAYFSLDDFKKSIASYQVIVSKYETSPNVPDAWLNIAACQQKLKDLASAKKTLKLLIAKFPDSKAAKKAKQRLAALK
jgi:tol-pal system protein YbgF